MTAAYDIPDVGLADIEADNRDAQDLRNEAKRQAIIDEMLSNDGDISPVIDRLSEEGCLEVIEFMRAYRNERGGRSAAHKLAVRLDSILDAVVDEQMEVDNV